MSGPGHVEEDIDEEISVTHIDYIHDNDNAGNGMEPRFVLKLQKTFEVGLEYDH